MEKPSKDTSNPTFSINSIEAGWISGCINDGKTEFCFDYSAADGDFPSSLLKTLLTEYGVLENDDNSNLFGWREPELDKWQIRQRKNSISITIKTYADNTANAALTETKQLNFNAETLIKDVIEAYKKTLWTYGLLGYKKSWWKEFPLAYLIKLMDFACNKNSITLQKKDMGNYKSSIPAESDYIKTLFFTER